MCIRDSLCLVSIYYFIIIAFRPSKFISVNKLESLSFLVIVTTISLGYLCTTEEASYSLKVFLIVIMAVFNASFFVSWFWKVAKDFIKKKIRSHDKLRPHLEKVENILKRRSVSYTHLTLPTIYSV
eukprot:TRINITY_DN11302_c0_g1_i2.p1 TRINITY_DN11302_c0_g1~~TRINITY_DN11302_c0_g1_i2.p1  ORF type:complete len:126 (-),score=11.60 TRINITY_DN11302_c0_g1_i2:33-410(-)